MPVDTALIGALHVEYLERRDLLDGGGGRPHHTLFRTSTIDALLEGKFDGDVSFAGLVGRKDFGLGVAHRTLARRRYPRPPSRGPG